MNLNSPAIIKKYQAIPKSSHNAFPEQSQEKHAGGDNLIAFASHVM